MKSLTFYLIFSLGLSVFAQENTYQFSLQDSPTEMTLEIVDLISDISIQGTKGNHVTIEAEGYRGLPEKAEGLRSLSAAGIDNTGIGLIVNQQPGKVSISQGDRAADGARYKLFVPEDLNLNIDYYNLFSGKVHIVGLKGQLEVKTFTESLELINVSGPVVAHSRDSDIKVVFTNIYQDLPSSISTATGDIDLTLPAKAKATFKISNQSGGVYTSDKLEVEASQDGVATLINKMNARLNGGGVEILLANMSGDIFIRTVR